MVPELGHHQWHERNGQQNARKRDAPQWTEIGTIDVGGEGRTWQHQQACKQKGHGLVAVLFHGMLT